MTAPSRQADLAALRALAEEGRNRPLLGGRDFILFGIAIAVAATLHGLVLDRVLAWPPMTLAAIWGVTMGGAGLLASTLRGKAEPIVLTVAQQVESAAWRTSGAFFAVLAISLFAFAFLSGEPDNFRFFALFPPVIFGVYAIAMAASAAAAKASFLKPFAVLAMGLSSLTAFLVGSSLQYYATAAGALIVSLLPGLMLLKRADG